MEGHYQLESSLQCNGDLDEALQQYQKVSELDPGSSKVYNSWDYTLYAQVKLDEAIIKWQQMKHVDPAMKHTYDFWMDIPQQFEVVFIESSDIEEKSIILILRKLEEEFELEHPIQLRHFDDTRLKVELKTKMDANLLFVAAKWIAN